MKDFVQLSDDIYSDIVSAPDEIGTPFEDAAYAPGPQERMDSCAIRAQQHVLSMFGIDVSETDLVNDAISHGEYSEDDTYGTSISDVGNLLERNGVDVHRFEGATIAHLISELGQGHKIIVGIDANEIIASGAEETLIEHVKDAIKEVPNHAVVVSNVDPNTLDVDIVDPADGKLHRIPAATFMDAWHDSNCFMVSTNSAPKGFNVDTTDIDNAMGVNSPIQRIDLDGDELTDIIGFDYNGDGKIDEYFIDFDHDGIPDVGKGGFISLSELGKAYGDQLPQLGSLGHVAGTDVVLGGLGHVGQEAMPQLGSLGHVAGEEADVALGGLGHVGQEAMPQLGSLGHVAGIEADVALGGLGHVGQESMPQLGSLGHVSGISVLGEGVYGFDVNGDGIPDVTISGIGGDGVPATMTIDLNGDGIPDVNGAVIDIGRTDAADLDLDGEDIADLTIDLE